MTRLINQFLFAVFFFCEAPAFLVTPRINVCRCSFDLKSLEFKNGFLFHFTPDINECTSEQHNCHQDANCINLKGSFNCTCKRGYRGNGVSCEGW